MNLAESFRSIQWKWVGLSFLMYLLIYLLPIIIVVRVTEGMRGASLVKTIGIAWMFGGPIVVAATAAYLSKGITIIEPAIAGVLFVIVTMIFVVELSDMQWGNQQFVRDVLIPHGIFLVLSLIGAWLGERIQKVSKKQVSATTD